MSDNCLEKFEFICETEKHKYYVSNQGYVLSVTSKSYKEHKLSGYVKHGRKNAPLIMKIGTAEHCVKHLVAQAFMKEYNGSKSNILHRDGNKRNCRVENLIIVPKNQVAKITGPLSRSQAIIVTDPNGNEIKYSSIRKAACKLNCSYQTLIDFINGRYKKSVLDGYVIKLC